MREQEALLEAVRRLHGGVPQWIKSVTVSEAFDGEVAWVREVSVFDLGPNAPVRRAFAWVETVAGTNRVRYFAVLQAGPIESARDAVRASIITDAGGPEGRSG